MTWLSLFPFVTVIGEPAVKLLYGWSPEKVVLKQKGQ